MGPPPTRRGFPRTPLDGSGPILQPLAGPDPRFGRQQMPALPSVLARTPQLCLSASPILVDGWPRGIRQGQFYAAMARCFTCLRCRTFVQGTHPHYQLVPAVTLPVTNMYAGTGVEPESALYPQRVTRRFGCGGRTCTDDLLVMSQASCCCSTPQCKITDFLRPSAVAQDDLRLYRSRQGALRR